METCHLIDTPKLYTEEHNGLAHINEAMHYDIDQYSKELILKMNRSFDVFKYGICRLHKHFDLEEDECVVTTYDPQERKYHSAVKPFDAAYLPW